VCKCTPIDCRCTMLYWTHILFPSIDSRKTWSKEPRYEYKIQFCVFLLFLALRDHSGGMVVQYIETWTSILWQRRKHHSSPFECCSIRVCTYIHRSCSRMTQVCVLYGATSRARDVGATSASRARTNTALPWRRSECVLSVPEHYDCVLRYQDGSSHIAKPTSPMQKAVATHDERWHVPQCTGCCNATESFVCTAASVLTSTTPVCFIISVLGSGLQRHQSGYIISHVTLAERPIVFGWGLGGCGASGGFR
jgi:hypothetical protein